MSKKTYTDQQRLAVDLLFDDEVAGDYRLAMTLAGYAESYPVSTWLEVVKDLIIEVGNSYMAANIPTAVKAVSDVLKNPASRTAKNSLDAANIVFDRGGLTKKAEQENVVHEVRHILILPPKEDAPMLDVTPAIAKLGLKDER